MRCELHQGREDFQVVAQDDFPDIPVRIGGEFQMDLGQARLEVKDRFPPRRYEFRRDFDTVAEFLHQKFQSRPPNVSQLFEDPADLLKPLLPLLMLLHLFNLKPADLFRSR